MRFFELYQVLEVQGEFERIAKELSENYEKMDPLDVIGRVRQLSIFAAHEPNLSQRQIKVLEHVFEVLNLSADEQIWASAQQLWAQVEMAKERLRV